MPRALAVYHPHIVVLEFSLLRIPTLSQEQLVVVRPYLASVCPTESHRKENLPVPHVHTIQELPTHLWHGPQYIPSVSSVATQPSY